MPTSHKRDARRIWVNENGDVYITFLYFQQCYSESIVTASGGVFYNTGCSANFVSRLQ